MSISPVAITIASPNAIIANTAVTCDNDCKLPTESQLPWVIIANPKEIRTTKLMVEDRSPSPGVSDALESLKIGLAATRSWKENRPVELSEL